MNTMFSIIQVAYAHEEGASTATADNTLGPILALVIIILAIVVAKRIKKINKENHYEQRN
ncbi:hypothetical protein A3G55_01835 [Candidatus Giovannonibacteria bacterium RIFCSPLOWO2_12_FULL_44_25]|uniref:Uncharacterized protein n=3 Tax=Parcubacteria group TaxID=1794811 RepID=A0A837IL13_9BACT|nr:MAG: hypothetical protein UW15_C0004G0050 [Parcubacteria group bacterium GW2011_GWC1_44_10]KKT60185.1 MAG: hypothetical protein UW53_C0003G0096 [Candidatus Giovannonibacteria bacterium GW2011_GWA1_44_25]KKU12472.1 MAG: hypothetical protein UX18_C0023G0017 [Candidatus Azambacteria bacterium GW2011_GWC2_45_7b]KKU30032.1 MAG: hypothetical protein UX43_C0003G0125 [Candidatus Giovannonibacteria bacterium GW2011_GWB1_46_20]OGF49390.1 MAG: hypothetical protein A2120_03670 [Candidatus Giovannonibact